MMNGRGMRINCNNCSEATSLKPAGFYGDGSLRLLCSCCEKDGGVLHRCPQDHPDAPPKWLPLLLAGIGIACPGCKKAYDLGVAVEPAYPQAGAALKAVGLLAGTLVLLGVIGDALNGGKRRQRR